MVSLQFILDTMIKFNKSLSKIISDLEESSPILKNSLLEISPVNFCLNIKDHQNIYIVIDRDNSTILFEEIEHQFEINGSLFELLKVVITKKINKNIIKGDQKCLSISSASIIAKQERDKLMTRLSINYPQYNWDKNVGYGTLGHKEAIEKFGISKYHRKSYKPILKIHDQLNN